MIEDIGPFEPDKGNGGKFLVLPPGYEGAVPDGYFAVRSDTYNVWIFLRASIAKGLDVAVNNVKDNFRIYPISKRDNLPDMEFISVSGKSFNTIGANNFKFYEDLKNSLARVAVVRAVIPASIGGTFVFQNRFLTTNL